ncbi:hypothetical protein CYL21_3647 [Plasmodium falciparum NF54]|uniref:Aspartyl protease n=3 Tax=Plasmodium falciparum TaxID=5833 RepID=Q8IJF2_PLAF7|nr:conserved protein, unknown function [Plasmodium falciparum 3D7]ETW48986.1 hypothetical protein PFMALIP_02943 [Plasmodium falciparum MaliPS096_E11]EWC88357.1 hypothetical protein PFNF54_02857 [Plasmodium falciparum NF54]KAF4327913.1 hypothetical protein CYL21_3647 [Plasmodium falciparum NF54]PKC43548.1 hypothetical protein CK202_4769 [Plasmodium falciparum NF54]CZT98508.1 conserved protein, unknown function [Plasmodium falciparum 3D7]|eukprot:XP_001347530.2 conserved Plasmodium protein, unknown function [Plasmodium falciparum 3D7]
MLLYFVIFIWSFLLCDIYETLNIRKSIDRKLTHLNNNIECALNISNYRNKKSKNLQFIGNNKIVKKCKNKYSNKVHLFGFSSKEEINNKGKKSLNIEKYEYKNGNIFLYTKLFVNNEEKKFIIDLCSDHSFIFEKRLNEELLKCNNNNNNNNIFTQNDFEQKSFPKNEGLNLQYEKKDIENIKELFHLNNTQVDIKKVVNIKHEKEKQFPFYVINNEELDMNFYGIIGFNFFKNYDTFVLDTIQMKILLNWNEDGINTEDPNYDNIEYEKQKGNGEQDQKEHEYYKINLYDYFNNIKYFNIYVDNHLYKGIVDTGTLNTILLNNSNIYNTTTDYNNKDTKTSIIIESVLKNKYKVNKTNINHINIITKDNHKIPVELNKYIYSGNLEYINKDVILLGLDFLLNKKLIFDLKNNILIIPKKYLNNTNEFNKKYDALNIGITNVQENQKSQNDNGNNHMDQIKIEDKCKEIYNQLKAKELNFVRITKELENDNVYMKDCKSTNDVIHKYAIKLLYGSNYLKKNDKNIEYEKRYNEVTEFFKKLNNEEKQNMLNKIVNSVLLLKRNDTIHDNNNNNNNNNNIINHQKQHSSNQGYEKASDIIHKFVNYEINNNVYSLHKFKSSNVNKNNPKSEEEEYKFLCNLYETHPEYSFEMLNDFKKELSSKKIPYNDCNDEKDIIKKVAHSRVFNNHKNNNKRKNVIVRKYSDDGNNIHTQIIIRGNGLNNNNNTSDDQDQNDYQYNNLDRMDDLFPNSIFSGLLKNFFIQNNNNNNNDGDGDYSSESFDQQNSSDDNQNDLFSELNNFFGFGNLADGMFGRKKKKKVLGFKTKEPQANLENNKENADDNITQAIKQEKDVDIIYLLNKVQKLNDINLKNFILQSLNNQNIRKILVDAVKKGYTNTYEQCKKENDNKSMYLLQMLKQSGIF